MAVLDKIQGIKTQVDPDTVNFLIEKATRQGCFLVCFFSFAIIKLSFFYL